MTGPVFPPMPVVLATTPGDRPLGSPGILIAGAPGLSVLSRVAAAEQFGAGSQLHAMASRLDPPPPPTPEEQAEIDRVRAVQSAITDRWLEGVNLHAAFVILGECISLVEVHANALDETDDSSLLTLAEWRGRAFDALAIMFDRYPELLPIGPDVHENCDRGDW